MQSGLTSLIPDIISVHTKQRIAGNFSRAASTYDNAATLQRRVALKLIDTIPDAEFQSVLDLGAGTGMHSCSLAKRYPQAFVTGMDLAMGMLRFARNQSTLTPALGWCSGDIESLPFKPDSFDLVFSSLAIQWCNLDRVLLEAWQSIRPGGFFVFSTLSDGSMDELDSAWKAISEPNRVNQFDSVKHQCARTVASDFQIKSFHSESETLYYADLLSLLRELKALGVNTVLSGNQGLMTRNRLLGLKNSYEHFRTHSGLPLTYQVVYVVLQKPVLKNQSGQ